MAQAENIRSWSKVATSNQNADPGINLVEFQSPSTLNDAVRALMATIAKFRDDIGAVATTGTGVAYSATTNTGYTALDNGLTLTVRAHINSTGAATLNVDALGPKKLRKITATGETDIAAGDIVSGGHYLVQYDTLADGGAGGWMFLSFSGGPFLSTTSTGNFATTGNILASNFIFQQDTDQNTGFYWLTDGSYSATHNGTVALVGTPTSYTYSVPLFCTSTLRVTGDNPKLELYDNSGTGAAIRAINNQDGVIGFINYIGSRVGYVDDSGNCVMNANFVISDARAKFDIKTIDDATALVSALRGVSYTKKDTGKHEVGLIAQEVQEVFPDLVHVDRSGFLSVSYQNLIGVLIQAVKEQNVRIAALEQKVRRK